MNDHLRDYNTYRISGGVPPLAPPSKYKRPRSLRMSDEGWDGLRLLAERLGYTYAGAGNVTALLEALGYNLWILTARVDNKEVAV